ncbi:MAG: hypothetical protein LH466_01905 [Sphingomonas bacterium]|nr:hypothetical protein [Sphingomonas bacterium]
MDSEQFFARQGYDSLDVAAVWPSSASVAPFPIPELEPISHRELFEATPAAPDVPAAVGGLIVASYAGLIAALAIATVGSGESIFVIVVAALFAVAFFTVPRLFFAVERDSGARASFDDFLRRGMNTFTGHNSGKAALVQMLIVPIMLTLGVAAMGITIAVVG